MGRVRALLGCPHGRPPPRTTRPGLPASIAQAPSHPSRCLVFEPWSPQVAVICPAGHGHSLSFASAFAEYLENGSILPRHLSWQLGVRASRTPLRRVRVKAQPSPSGNAIRQGRVLAALRAAPPLSNGIASPPSAFATWQVLETTPMKGFAQNQTSKGN